MVARWIPTSNEISPLVLNLVGDDLGMLIGRRGETLRDLQFIARLIISRRLGVWPNVVIDVENYKTKRITALESLARRMADQVRNTRKPVALEPMPASERRIIHLAYEMTRMFIPRALARMRHERCRSCPDRPTGGGCESTP